MPSTSAASRRTASAFAIAAGFSALAAAAPQDQPESPRAIILTAVSSASPLQIEDSRIDPNTPQSEFAGVASLFIGGRHLATGTAISRRHILTAAHCFDLDNDGVNENGTDVAIFFNIDDGPPITIPPTEVESVDFHPDFTGFLNPSINDDLALITLRSPLPEETPHYRLHRQPIDQGQRIELVGYGETGDGLAGYAAGTGFFTTKRIGANVADRFFSDDGGSSILELWQFDFDGPTGNGFLGGETLGEGVEATLGPGDSGGPGFVRTRRGLQLASVNNFVSGPGRAGEFGSGGGGVLVNAYLDWLDSHVPPRRISDINGDDVVDQIDLRILVASWGTSDVEADLNGDGVVNNEDFAMLLADWDN